MRPIVSGLLLWGFFLHPPVVSAHVWHVPAGAPTIQAAIDSASASDTVLVADGTYAGPGNRDLDLHGKSVVVKSQNGPEVTAIECGGSESEPHRAFIFQSGETPRAVVDGFTVRGGYMNNGGAVSVNSATPIIANCIFSGNRATYFGGAIDCDLYGTATIRNCTFTGNTAYGAGAIYVFYDAYPTIESCTFSGNTALYGAAVMSRTYPSLLHCVFAFNLQGGAISGCAGLLCCDIYGNVGGDWVGCIAGQLGTNGNFSADPIFCDRDAGDFHLSASSPCLHAPDCGLIGAWGEGCPSTDVAGGRTARLSWGLVKALFQEPGER